MGAGCSNAGSTEENVQGGGEGPVTRVRRRHSVSEAKGTPQQQDVEGGGGFMGDSSSDGNSESAGAENPLVKKTRRRSSGASPQDLKNLKDPSLKKPSTVATPTLVSKYKRLGTVDYTSIGKIIHLLGDHTHGMTIIPSSWLQCASSVTSFNTIANKGSSVPPSPESLLFEREEGGLLEMGDVDAGFENEMFDLIAGLTRADDSDDEEDDEDGGDKKGAAKKKKSVSSSVKVQVRESTAFASAITILRCISDSEEMTMMVRVADQFNSIHHQQHHPTSSSSASRLFGGDAPLLHNLEIIAQQQQQQQTVPLSSVEAPNTHFLSSADRDALLLGTAATAAAAATTPTANNRRRSSSTTAAAPPVISSPTPAVIRAICKAISIVITELLRHVALKGLIPYVKQRGRRSSSVLAASRVIDMESAATASKSAQSCFFSDGEFWGSVLKNTKASESLTTAASKGGTSCEAAVAPVFKAWVSKAVKLVYAYIGGLENLRASDTSSSSAFSSSAPDDVSLQSLVEIRGVSRMWFLGKVLGFDPFGGMRTAEEASDAAAVVRDLCFTTGLIQPPPPPSINSAAVSPNNNGNSGDNSAFMSWYAQFPHFFMSVEGRLNALYLESVLRGQTRLQLQPLRRGNILKSASSLIPGSPDYLAGGGAAAAAGSPWGPRSGSKAGHRSSSRAGSSSGGGMSGSRLGGGAARKGGDGLVSEATTYKVFPLFTRDGVGLESGEGHGPRKEFFDGCGHMSTATSEPEVDLSVFLRGGRAAVLSSSPQFKDISERLLELLLVTSSGGGNRAGGTTASSGFVSPMLSKQAASRPPIPSSPSPQSRQNNINHNSSSPSSNLFAKPHHFSSSSSSHTWTVESIKKDLLSPLKNGTLLLLDPATATVSTVEFLANLKQGDAIRYSYREQNEGGGSTSSKHAKHHHHPPPQQQQSASVVKRVVQVIDTLVLVELQSKVPTAELTLPQQGGGGRPQSTGEGGGGHSVFAKLPYLASCRLAPSAVPPLIHERNKQFAWLNPAMVGALAAAKMAPSAGGGGGDDSHTMSPTRNLYLENHGSSPHQTSSPSGARRGSASGDYSNSNSNSSPILGVAGGGNSHSWTLGWCIGNAASNGCTLPVALPPLLFFMAQHANAFINSTSSNGTGGHHQQRRRSSIGGGPAPLLSSSSSAPLSPLTSGTLSLLNADAMSNARKAYRWSVEEFSMILRIENEDANDEDSEDDDDDGDDDDTENAFIKKIRRQNRQKKREDYESRLRRIRTDPAYFKSELTAYIQEHIVVGSIYGGFGGGAEEQSGRAMIRSLLEGFRSSPVSSSPVFLYASPRVAQLTLCGGTDDGISDFNFETWFRLLLDRELTHFAHGRIFKDLLFECLETSAFDSSITTTAAASLTSPLPPMSPLERKRQLLRFITGRTLLPSRKREEHLKVDLPLLPMAAKEFDRILVRLPSSHSCDNVLEIPNYLEGLLFGSKSPFYTVAKRKVGSMVMESHKEGGWFMISESARQGMIAETRRHLSEKLWSAVLQSDTYELDDGAISKELRERTTTADSFNSVAVGNLPQLLNEFEDHQKDGSASATTTTNSNTTAATTATTGLPIRRVVASPVLQVEEEHFFYNDSNTQLAPLSPNSTSYTHNSNSRQQQQTMSLGSRGAGGGNSSSTSPIGNERAVSRTGAGAGDKTSPLVAAAAANVGQLNPTDLHNSSNGGGGSIVGGPSMMSLPNIPQNSPLQKAAAIIAAKNASSTSPDAFGGSVNSSSTHMESSLYRRRNPTTSSQQHQQQAGDGEMGGMKAEAESATTKRRAKDLDALEEELFGN